MSHLSLKRFPCTSLDQPLLRQDLVNFIFIHDMVVWCGYITFWINQNFSTLILTTHCQKSEKDSKKPCHLKHIVLKKLFCWFDFCRWISIRLILSYQERKISMFALFQLKTWERVWRDYRREGGGGLTYPLTVNQP